MRLEIPFVVLLVSVSILDNYPLDLQPIAVGHTDCPFDGQIRDINQCISK